MDVQEIVEICLCCLGYAYEQLQISEIDIFGFYEGNPESWKATSINKILNAYLQLDMLTPNEVYRNIPYGEIVKYLEVNNGIHNV